jgi:predicted O-methyltransferase YrrM
VAGTGDGVTPSAPVETFQAEWELGQLLKVVEEIPHNSILEVGAMWGGTLWYWVRHAYNLTVVDDEMRNADEWAGWAKNWGCELHLVAGSSHDPAIVAQAAEFAPYDFAFIDADHTYQAVRADWENYGPMARVVAFHDILPRPGYGVSQLWEELTAVPGARYVTICQNEVMPGNEGRCGVGVLWT